MHIYIYIGSVECTSTVHISIENRKNSPAFPFFCWIFYPLYCISGNLYISGYFSLSFFFCYGITCKNTGYTRLYFFILFCTGCRRRPTESSHGQTFDPLHFFNTLCWQIKRRGRGHQPFPNKIKYRWPKVSVRVGSVLVSHPFLRI